MAVEKEAIQAVSPEKVKAGGVLFKASRILALGTGLLLGLAVVRLYQHLKNPDHEHMKQDLPKGLDTQPALPRGGRID